MHSSNFPFSPPGKAQSIAVRWPHRSGVRSDRDAGRSPYGRRCCGPRALGALRPRRAILPPLSRMKTPLTTRGSLCLAFPGPSIRGEGAAAAAQSPSVGAANGRSGAVGWRNPEALQKQPSGSPTRCSPRAVPPTPRPQLSVPNPRCHRRVPSVRQERSAGIRRAEPPGCVPGTERPSGAVGRPPPFPHLRHSPLEHAGSGTRSVRSALFLFLFPRFCFFFFSSLFPFSLPSQRGGAKGDGPAGSLTLALPLCPPLPPAAAFPSPEPGRGPRRKSFGLFPLPPRGDTPTPSQSPHPPPGGPTLPSPLKRLQTTSRSRSVRRKHTQLSPIPTLNSLPSSQRAAVPPQQLPGDPCSAAAHTPPGTPCPSAPSLPVPGAHRTVCAVTQGEVGMWSTRVSGS